MRKALKPLFLVLAAGAVLLGACSSDDADDGATTTSAAMVTTTTAADTAATGPDGETDGQAAEPPTEEEAYIEEAVAVCTDTVAVVQGLEQASDEADLARYLGEVAMAIADGYEKLDAIEPPADAAKLHESFLAATAKGLETIGGAVTAAEKGDTVSAGDLFAQAQAELASVNDELDAYGLAACGSGET